MFNPHITYPVDGLLISRPGRNGRPGEDPAHAIVTAQVNPNGQDMVDLGRVYEVANYDTSQFRIANGQTYGYRYFRGAWLNTPTATGNPVMLLGPDGVDLPWVVGSVVERQDLERITVTPLWGPSGHPVLPHRITGDSWVRVVATPPPHLLWHPGDDEVGAQAKQTTRDLWLRWHVAWHTLLREAAERGWMHYFKEIAEAVEYEPPRLKWTGEVETQFGMPLAPPTEEQITAARRNWNTEIGGGRVGRTMVSFTAPLPISYRSDFPEEDLRPYLIDAVNNRVSYEGIYLSHFGGTILPDEN